MTDRNLKNGQEGNRKIAGQVWSACGCTTGQEPGLIFTCCQTDKPPRLRILNAPRRPNCLAKLRGLMGYGMSQTATPTGFLKDQDSTDLPARSTATGQRQQLPATFSAEGLAG